MAFPLTRKEHDAIDARIKALPELIVAAAVNTPYGIITRERPARHGDLWGLLPKGLSSSDPDCIHGFLTSHGRFVDRLTAGNLVLKTGQGSPRGVPFTYDNYLFSEDMWLDLFELVPKASYATDGGPTPGLSSKPSENTANQQGER